MLALHGLELLLNRQQRRVAVAALAERALELLLGGGAPLRLVLHRRVRVRDAHPARAHRLHPLVHLALGLGGEHDALAVGVREHEGVLLHRARVDRPHVPLLQQHHARRLVPKACAEPSVNTLARCQPFESVTHGGARL